MLLIVTGTTPAFVATTAVRTCSAAATVLTECTAAGAAAAATSTSCTAPRERTSSMADPATRSCHGGSDNDLLVADPTPPVHRRGNSQLYGEDGDDTLNAVNNAPTDTLDGGAGTDACTGDPGDTISGCP
jgi:hypothetical protein